MVLTANRLVRVTLGPGEGCFRGVARDRSRDSPMTSIIAKLRRAHQPLLLGARAAKIVNGGSHTIGSLWAHGIAGIPLTAPNGLGAHYRYPNVTSPTDTFAAIYIPILSRFDSSTLPQSSSRFHLTPLVLEILESSIPHCSFPISPHHQSKASKQTTVQ